MSRRSALYVGCVMHRRLRPRYHRFRYRAFWFLLDLDELPEVAGCSLLFSYNRRNLFSLHDRDHGDGTTTPIRWQIEKRLCEAGINPVDGRIQLLCMPRTIGYAFNPLSIYYCHRQDGSLSAIVYEVHNTFGERHSYLIPVDTYREVVRQQCRKAFYVSPFMDMDLHYAFRLTQPDDHISVAIRANAGRNPAMVAVLAGARREFTDLALLGTFLSIGAVTLKVIGAIHWEAFRLWLKRIHFRPRPSARAYEATIMGLRGPGPHKP
jgi:uncharacterized protein